MIIFKFLLFSYFSAHSLVASSSSCLQITNWKFYINSTGTTVSVKTGMSLTDPAQKLTDYEGYYITRIPSSMISSFLNPSLLIPAVGGLKGISINDQNYAIPFSDYSSVGPIIALQEVKNGDLTLKLIINGDKTSYAGLWKAAPIVCEHKQVFAINANNELWQKHIPNFIAAVCLVFSILFIFIFYYTGKKFIFYSRFSMSMITWSVYFFVLGGVLKSYFSEQSNWLLFPARTLGSLGLLLILYSYLSDYRYRNYDRLIIGTNILLIFISILGSFFHNSNLQISMYVISIMLHAPITYMIIKKSFDTKELKVTSILASIAFFGEILDLSKFVGPMFGFISSLPYINRATMPPILLFSITYFLLHFIGYFKESRQSEFKNRILGKFSLLSARNEKFDEYSLAKVCGVSRRLHMANRAGLAKRLSDGSYQMIEVSGYSREAIGEIVRVNDFEHISNAVQTGEICFADVPISDKKKYKNGTCLVAPIPLKENPDYIIFVSDIQKGNIFELKNIGLSRHFFTTISALYEAYTNMQSKKHKEMEFQNLVKKLDPSLFNFIQKQVDDQRLTVDESQERGVIYFDQKGWTSMIEKLPAGEAALAMREIKQWVANGCLRQNARIKGFFGDAFVVEVFSNLGESRSQTIIRTAHLAWELCDGVDVLNRRLLELSLPMISYRFGVTFGVTINIDLDLIDGGSTALIGDAVNLAQRIQDKAKPGTVYVSSQVAEEAQNDFSLIPIKNTYVKGRVGVVKIFRIIGINKQSGQGEVI